MKTVYICYDRFFSLFRIKWCFTNFFFAKTRFYLVVKVWFFLLFSLDEYSYFFSFSATICELNSWNAVFSTSSGSFVISGFFLFVHSTKHFVVAPDNFSIHISFLCEKCITRNRARWKLCAYILFCEICCYCCCWRRQQRWSAIYVACPQNFPVVPLHVIPFNTFSVLFAFSLILMEFLFCKYFSLWNNIGISVEWELRECQERRLKRLNRFILVFSLSRYFELFVKIFLYSAISWYTKRTIQWCEK